MFRLVLSIISVILAIQLAACGNGNPPASPTTPATQQPNSPPPPSLTATLIIDRVDLTSHPRSGPWLMCFRANAGEARNTFNLAGKAYSGDEVSVDMGLPLAPIEAGTPVNFSLLMDDDAARACGTDAKDQSLDTFGAGTGETTVQRDKFHYVIHYYIVTT